MARLGESAEKGKRLSKESYLPSAKQVLARPAKAKTEVNFMMTSLEAAGDYREWEDVREFVDFESCHNSGAMS